jgi:hypothetical protein
LVARWAAAAPVGPGGRVAGHGSVRTRAARPVEAPAGPAVEAGTPTAAGSAAARRWSPPQPPAIRRGLQATPWDLLEDHPAARGHRRPTPPVHPAVEREPQARGNPPSGAPAGGRRPRAVRRDPRPGPAGAEQGPRALLESSPPEGLGAGRRVCPWQAGPSGPPDVTPSVESNRALGLERCPGLEQRLGQEQSTGAPELQGAPELGPLPPPLGVARALGGSPDRRRTSSQVERAATPIPGRDRWEREAGRQWDGERSAAPARFRCPARERPAGTSVRSAPPRARPIPPRTRPTPRRPQPTRSGLRSTGPRAWKTRPRPLPSPLRSEPTRPHPRSTPLGARRTPPRAQPTPPPARSAPLPAQGTASRVPQPLGPDRLWDAAPPRWPHPARRRPRSSTRGPPPVPRPVRAPLPRSLSAREPESPPGPTSAESRADRGRHRARAAGPVAAARLPGAPSRRVAQAGPRPARARGRVAPRPERTDRTRDRRGRGRTSQEAPPEHGRRDPVAERPRLGAGPRTAWPAAWTCWSPPNRGPAAGPTRTVRPVLAGLVGEALTGRLGRSSGPRKLPRAAPRAGVGPSLSRRGRFCEDCPQPGRSHTAGRR